MTTFDSNGNPDVMGSREMTKSQLSSATEVREMFNDIHGRLMPTPGEHNPEAARLFALARTHLEMACMFAVKGISRSAVDVQKVKE